MWRISSRAKPSCFSSGVRDLSIETSRPVMFIWTSSAFVGLFWRVSLYISFASTPKSASFLPNLTCLTFTSSAMICS